MKRLLLLLLLLARPASAQFLEDFESGSNRWIETSADGGVPNAVWRTATDPAGAANRVFSARHIPARQRSTGRAPGGDRPEVGAYATSTLRWFSAERGFEYRGRFYRSRDGLIGFTFLSGLPEERSSYLLALWRKPVLQLFAEGTPPSDTTFAPQADRWYRFIIRVDDVAGATRIRTRFWADGDHEPEADSLDVMHEGAHRRTGGRIGVWSAGGQVYVDDLSVAAQTLEIADTTPPAISFSESGVALPAASRTAINHEARVQVSAVDASGIALLEVTADGVPYLPGEAIAPDGVHTIRARAVDAAGNAATAEVQVVVDKTPPKITILRDGKPVVPGSIFGAAVRPVISVNDVTDVAVSATLNGAPFVAGSEVAAEGDYVLSASATDAVGWHSSLQLPFTIDLTPPSIVFLEAGRLLESGKRNFLDHDARVHVQTTGELRRLTVDGQPYSAGDPIVGEGLHVLRAEAVDTAGLSIDAQVELFIDKTPPRIEVTGVPVITRENVRPSIRVVDATDVLVTATVDGTTLADGADVAAEGRHTLHVRAKDAAGWTTDHPPIEFTIDRTPPAIAFLTPAPDSTVGAPNITVTGEADDAVRVTVNGVAAVIDGKTRRFTATPVIIAEGANVLTAVGVDAAGNQSSVLATITLDSQGPRLTVISPVPNACLDAHDVLLRGTVVDNGAVRVSVNGVAATVNGPGWSVSVPVASEGPVVFAIEASDDSQHVARMTVPVTIDRTAPVVEVTESGGPFTADVVNRPLAFLILPRDSDPTASTRVMLDGAAYVSNTPITAEGLHVLTATATDCAGHVSPETTLRFAIDRTPPTIEVANPSAGSTITERSVIRGRLSEEGEVVVGGVPASMSGLEFTVDVPLSEGRNELELVSRDRAGNETRLVHAFTLATRSPAVEILENGEPIAVDALFPRAVKPEFRSSDPSATVVATLDDQPYTPGTLVTAEGRHTLTATATNAAGLRGSASTTFTIDRTAPIITITAPADGAVVAGESVEVRGTVSDALTVTVNGLPALVANGSFTASVTFHDGPLLIVAVASDAAGNRGRAQIEVTRAAERIGLILTSPPDGLLTNRPTTVVAGQVLRPAPVTINGADMATDPAGNFRRTDFALQEGENLITARADASSVSVKVIADFTPPVLRVTADGRELQDGARFVSSPQFAIEAGGAAIQSLTIDGAPDSSVPLSHGGHSLTAIARDAAGNETRVDRTFFIGDSTAGFGCALSGFDPPSGTAHSGETLRLTGRSGGAAGVLVNGVRADLADGTFCVTIPLAPGPNRVIVQCADATGAATADPPVELSFERWAEPEIAITSPPHGARLRAATVTVTGTTGAGAVDGDVNGLPFAVASNSFSVAGVALTPGLNVIAVRVRSASGRVAVATRHVFHDGGTPGIEITSPLPGSETGAATIDVTGTYTNVDPATISIGNATVITRAATDTSGTFRAELPLAPDVPTTITAGTASVTVTRVNGHPSISILTPADNSTVVGSSARVTGTFAAIPGAQVSVNGVAATISGDAFAADVALSGTTVVIARVVTPDGVSAADVVLLTARTAAPSVKSTFPTKGAVDVDRSVALVVLFSGVVEKTDVAIQLRDAANAVVAGELFVDRDAATFAPAQPLRPGEHYTVVANGESFGFTTARSAPLTPPQVDQADGGGCLTTSVISGTASAPGARMRLEIDGVAMTGTANASGAYRFEFAFSGQPGYHAARIRELGADGSVSPERALCFRVNCAAPRVVDAVLDRDNRKLVIQFSRDMDADSLTSAVVLEPSVTFTTTTGERTLTLALSTVPDTLKVIVRTSAKDRAGNQLHPEFTKTFTRTTESPAGQGIGHVSGAVYDATNGRPLAGAEVVVGNEVVIADERGRYSRRLPEGAHTIRAAALGYTTVWRQVIVPAGAGVVPIDIRLTKRGEGLQHGGDTTVTRPVSLTLAAPLPNRIAVTSAGAQSLAGLLPLGWSPLASVEITVDDSSTPIALPGARLTLPFDASVPLSLVSYDSDRDEWRVEIAVVTGPVVDVARSGNYALVYPDHLPHLVRPPAPRTGDALQGVADPCAADATICRLTSRSFTLAPRTVLPNGRTVATLVTEGALQPYPSGTAVQAFIDEQLNLADGTTHVEPPFATDLLVYRTLAGDTGVADFHLAPSRRAAEVLLRDGVEQIRIIDYPGRVDRGALIGAEGGRVPGDGSVTVDVPAGAADEPLHASVVALPFKDTVAGFTVAGAFTLTLTRASEPPPIEGVSTVAPSLLRAARATVRVSRSLLSAASQVVIAEVIDGKPRLAAIATGEQTLDTVRLFVTRSIDRSQLPLDGIVRSGSYLVLVANAPIAYAFGQVRVSDVGTSGVRVTSGVGSPMSAMLGVVDITRSGGTFVVPVAARPAAPFSLVARSSSVGEGSTFVHGSVPEADTFVEFGVLPLAPRAPRLEGITPSDGALLDVNTPLVVQARFDTSLDAGSVQGGLVVVDVATGVALAGTVSGAANLLSFAASTPLLPAAQYRVIVAPSIRGTNGAAFGRTHVTTFSTRAIPAGNTTIRAERLRITAPDPNGRVTISGTAGALPVGSQAIAVRRGRFFIEGYQTTVTHADGSFAFDAGHAHASDRVSVRDTIDLRVLDPVSRAVVAVIRLTPFVTADGRGFYAPTGETTTFTTADGVAVTVPKDAFDDLTLVTVTRNDAPPLPTDELQFAAGIEVTFDGSARVPLEIEIPIPPNTPTQNRTFYLGRLGASSRGPRIEIVDTVFVEGALFTTRQPAAPRTLQTTTGTSLRESLIRTVRSGRYSVLDIRVPAGNTLGWAAVDGLQGQLELFFDHFHSLYSPVTSFVEGRGRAVVPVLSGVAFTVEGVDTSTGLEAFTRRYDGVIVNDNNLPVLTSPQPNPAGPYPIFGRPFFVEQVDLQVADTDLTSVPGFRVRLAGGIATITRTGATPTTFDVINVTTGLRGTGERESRTVAASVGDRLVIVGGAVDVAPSRTVELVFSEVVHAQNLASQIRLEQKRSGEWQSLAGQYNVDIDSSGRRVTVIFSGELQRGGEYRLFLDGSITDLGDPRKQLVGGQMILPFTIRKPHGEVTAFELGKGGVRDLALDGNVLYVSALEGGLYAYDVSDPAALATRPPLARAIAFPENAPVPGASWAVSVDRHGRIWTTAVTSQSGVVRSFRTEHFTAGDALVDPTATAIVSWRPGINAGLPLGTTYSTQGDRVEATPRRLQVLLQDESFTETISDAQILVGNPLRATAALGAANGGFRTYNITIPKSRDFPYRLQRVSIENTTLGVRWAADIATGSASEVTLNGVLVRNGDVINVSRNLRTYGALSLFGHGVGLYDLNAVESNNLRGSLPSPSYVKVAEQLVVTSADADEICSDASAPAGLPCLPANLNLIADAVAVSDPTSALHILGLENKKGLVDVVVMPEQRLARRTGGLAFTGSYSCPGGLCWVDHPRLATLRAKFTEAHRSLNARFNTLARYDVRDGAVTKSYGLIAANQFGILVVDLNEPPSMASLVDIIWVSSGAFAVRVVPGTRYATAVDGYGRSMLIDLTRIDERTTLPECTSAPCLAPLFESVSKAIGSGAVANDPLSFGTDDPRVIFKSAIPASATALAPVADPETGFLFKGELLAATLRAIAGNDPQMRVKSVNGTEMTAVVPMGIAAPEPLSSFRAEVSLPGGIAGDSGLLSLEVASVTPSGSSAPDTNTPLAPSKLTDVALHRVLPSGRPELRYQRGYNRFVSDWVSVIGDPRASRLYWPPETDEATMEAAGCYGCKRAELLADAREIFSTGHALVLRPRFAGGDSSYLTSNRRLERSLKSIPADVVREPKVRIAPQNPPVAGGALQEVTYLHSGEVETSSVDLNAGGRNGWDVTIDRTYRSRSIGGTPFGAGWSSSIFRRLRVLPDGAVEYRDGQGEVWIFTRRSGEYVAPAGLFLKLTRAERGWTLVDPLWRLTSFDELGRLTGEGDEFYNPARPSGNVITYLYDADGRLATIVDPVGRTTELVYDARGQVREIKDWRGRLVTYTHDSRGRLERVELPSIANPHVQGESAVFAGRPTMRYRYDGSVASYKDQLELATNLTSIHDPVHSGDNARVKFEYEMPAESTQGDRVRSQRWGTGETGRFAYQSDTAIVVTDALNQVRTYELSRWPDQQLHVKKLTAHELRLVQVTALPASAPLRAETTPHDPETTYSYDEHGQILDVTYPEGSSDRFDYAAVANFAVPKLLQKSTRTGNGVAEETLVQYDDASARNTPKAIGRAAVGSAPQYRETQSPSRERHEVKTKDEQITRVAKYDPTGALTSDEQKDESESAITRKTTFTHYGATSTQVDRGRIRTVVQGDPNGGDIKQTFSFSTLPAGGEKETLRDEIRRTISETELDALGRVIKRTVSEEDGDIASLEVFGYDASGQMVYHKRNQQNVGEVVSRTEYDAMGRVLKNSISGAVVNGGPATITTETEYDLPRRAITTFDPYLANRVAKTTQRLDGLGRTVSEERVALGSDTPLSSFVAYDLGGRTSWESDGTRSAVLRQYDGKGREIGSVRADKLKTTNEWNVWGELTSTTTTDGDGALVAKSANAYTPQGSTRATTRQVDAGGRSRLTRVDWTPGAKTTTTRTAAVSSVGAFELPSGRHRAAQRTSDLAGREILSQVGSLEGSALAMTATDTLVSSVYAYAGSVLVGQTTLEPQAGASTITTFSRDALGRPTTQFEAGGLPAKMRYDDAGNLLGLTRPGYHDEEVLTYDARGLAVSRKLPGVLRAQQMRYDERGALVGFVDEAGEMTTWRRDALGRVVKIEYSDCAGGTAPCTFEELDYYADGAGPLKARRDRSGQWLSFKYGLEGRIASIHDGRDPSAARMLVEYQYFASGLLKRVRNAWAALEYESYDLLGRPQITRAIRFADGSGLAQAPTVSDVHTQRHAWSIHDAERLSWRFPAAGNSLPARDDALSQWLETIVEVRDEGSNIVEQKTGLGRTLTSGSTRSVGRLKSRSVIASGGTPVVTRFGFADGTAAAAQIELPAPETSGPSQTGLPLWSLTAIGESRRAGTSNARDASRRVSALRDLAMGDRLSKWAYDDKGRMTQAWLSVADPNASSPIVDTFVDADFRAARTATSMLTAEQRMQLGSEAENIGPLSWTATQTAGHQIGQRELQLDGATLAIEPYAFSGGRRTRGGDWTSSYDAFGRLSSIESVADGRRIEYVWNPDDRLVGRVAKKRNGDVWAIEDRPAVLSADGLQAETTFLWDPMVDRLVAIAAAGKSIEPNAGPSAGLLRQMLHGDQGYDDPLFILRADAAGSEPRTFMPVVDHAGAGSVIAVLDGKGDLVERVLYADSYGDEPRYLQGPVVDRIHFEAAKNSRGEVTEVKVTARLSERVIEETLAAGVRLAAVKSDGTVARLSLIAPALADRFTITWTLTPAEWTALSTAPNAASLEIAFSSSLRAEGWGSASVAAPPSWTRRLYPGAATTADHPLLYRQPLPSLREKIGTLSAASRLDLPLYELPTLYSAALPDSRSQLLTGFHALPFVEPATELVYARARWYSARTGTFMSPDPMRYRDSSNLYAIVSGDPVNHRDPTGAYQTDVHFYAVYFIARAQGLGHATASDIAWSSQHVDDNSFSEPLFNAVKRPDKLRAFHFLAYGDDRVQRDNPYVRTLVEEAIATANPVRFGITLHTYADSFSHESFTAFFDSRNLRSGPASVAAIAVSTSLQLKGIPVVPKLAGHMGESHGGTSNDLPYNNVAKAIELSAHLYQYMDRFGRSYSGAAYPEHAGKRLTFAHIEPMLRAAFSTKGDSEKRAKQWQDLIRTTFGDTVIYDESANFGPRQHEDVFLRDQLERASALAGPRP